MEVYTLQQVLKNIYFDIIQWMDNHEGSISLDDLLLTIAVPCARLDYAQTDYQKQTLIMKDVNKIIKRNNLRCNRYTKQGLRNIMAEKWLQGLAETEKCRLVTDQYSLLDSASLADGSISLNDRIEQLYRKLMSSPNNGAIEYSDEDPDPLGRVRRPRAAKVACNA